MPQASADRVRWHEARAPAGVDGARRPPCFLGRANLDGTGVNESFRTRDIMPGGSSAIASDDTYLYWGINHGWIGRMKLDGTEADPRFIETTGSPYDIAIDDEHIYWTNTTTETIGWPNLDGTGNDQFFIARVGSGALYDFEVLTCARYVRAS